MKTCVIIILLLCVIGAGFYFAGSRYIVKTSDGIKTYPKGEFGMSDTYVDMTKMSFIDLRQHMDLAKEMTNQGDIDYIPGGPEIKKMAEMGIGVADTITKFDSEYKLSSSLNEIGRIGFEKWEAANEKYNIDDKVIKTGQYLEDQANQLNEKYNVDDKINQAGQYLEQKGIQLNDWLKSQ